MQRNGIAYERSAWGKGGQALLLNRTNSVSASECYRGHEAFASAGLIDGVSHLRAGASCLPGVPSKLASVPGQPASRPRSQFEPSFLFPDHPFILRPQSL